MREELQGGFRIGERLVEWGTLVGAIPGGAEGANGAVRLPCRAAYGLPVITAELAGPASDRPVMSVNYALAHAGKGGANGLIAALTERLGGPADLGREAAPAHSDPADRVVEWASWRLDDVAVGISIYGAPRRTDDGPSAGMLWISLSDERAAGPFLRDWLDRCAAVAAAATRLTQIDVFQLGLPQYPLYGPVDGSGSITPGSSAERRRIASLCLRKPRIVATPPSVASRLTPESIAIWTADANGLWCLSTAWDSLAHRIGEPVIANHAEFLPARGPGYVLLDVGGWSIRAGYPSPAIAAAAARLARLPGVGLRHGEGHDC